MDTKKKYSLFSHCRSSASSCSCTSPCCKLCNSYPLQTSLLLLIQVLFGAVRTPDTRSLKKDGGEPRQCSLWIPDLVHLSKPVDCTESKWGSWGEMSFFWVLRRSVLCSPFNRACVQRGYSHWQHLQWPTTWGIESSAQTVLRVKSHYWAFAAHTSTVTGTTMHREAAGEE